MKSLVKKILALGTAAVMLTALAGCDKESEEKGNMVGGSIDDNEVVYQEDMPYGSTLTKLTAESGKVDITIEYDHRFLTEEEAIKITQYNSAINNNDYELFEQVVHPAYLEYMIESAGALSAQHYLENVCEDLKSNVLAGDFKFTYILTSDCLDETADSSETSFSYVDAIIRQYDSEALTGKTITRKLVSFDILYSLDGDGGSHSMTTKTGDETKFYVYTIDGQIYIL